MVFAHPIAKAYQLQQQLTPTSPIVGFACHSARSNTYSHDISTDTDEHQTAVLVQLSSVPEPSFRIHGETHTARVFDHFTRGALLCERAAARVKAREYLI